MKYLFIAFLFISSFTYSQGIEPSSFQPTPYLGGVLRGVTPFVDEFTGQTYYLYVHDSLDASVPYVDTIFMTDFNLYYIKNGDTIYVGSVTDSSFIYNVVSDTFALDMDIDSTNELQELFHQDNILVLTGAGPDSQVDLTTYMNVDTIYMNDYDLWYYNLLESEPYFIGNVTDSTYIKQVVSDSSTVVENDYGTIIVESPANTFGVTVDSTKFFSVYAGSLKENALTFTSPLSRSVNTISIPAATGSVNGHLTAADWTTFNGKPSGTGVNLRVAHWNGTNSVTYRDELRSEPSYLFTGYTEGIHINGANASYASGVKFRNSGYAHCSLGLKGSSFVFSNTSSNELTLWASPTDRLLINMSSGVVNIPNLAGSGTRFVTSTSTGDLGNSSFDLSTLTTGSGTTPRLAFWSGTNTLTSTANLRSESNYLYTGYSEGIHINGANASYASGVKFRNSGYAHCSFGMKGSSFVFSNTSSNELTLWASPTDRLLINMSSGVVNIPNLAGSGTRLVTSTSTGDLGAGIDASTIGDITAVTVSAPITGGGTSGSVNIAVDTTDATSAALATQFDLLGKQATLVSGTNIKTVNSNSLVGSGNVSVGTVTSITAAAPLTGGAITTSGTIGVDTTASTGSALATQFDISTKVSGSGTDNYIPRFNGTTAIENSIMYDDGTNIGIGTASPTAKLSVAGALKVTGSTSGNTRIWGYDHTDGTMGIITIGSGLSLSGDALSATAAYAYWRLSANSGTAFAVTDNTLVNFNNSTGISWTRAASTGEMTATLADNSATNEIQSLSYNTGTRALGISSGSGVTLPLVTSSIAGLVSAYPNNTTSFLRGDGTWATPPTPAVTGSAPIVVTSGNISLNFGNGLALSGSQLQTTPVIMAFLNHSSGGYTTNFTAGETKKVDFTTALSNSSITTDVSTNDNITINSAGTYEINYNVCINAPTNFDEPTVSIYVNGSQQGTTVKSVWLTVAGQKQCISGTHVMALSSSNTVDMRVQHPQAQTGANIIAPQLKVQKLF